MRSLPYPRRQPGIPPAEYIAGLQRFVDDSLHLRDQLRYYTKLATPLLSESVRLSVEARILESIHANVALLGTANLQFSSIYGEPMMMRHPDREQIAVVQDFGIDEAGDYIAKVIHPDPAWDLRAGNQLSLLPMKSPPNRLLQ